MKKMGALWYDSSRANLLEPILGRFTLVSAANPYEPTVGELRTAMFFVVGKLVR